MKLLDVIVIGGGLSGVLVSHGLQQQQQQQRNWRLLEARPVLGGRLANDPDGHKIDMGGAWVWPTHQPRMRKLLRDLDIPTFAQPDDPSSTRIDGGAVRLVERLAQDLPNEQIQLNSPVKSCTLKYIDENNGGDVVDQNKETSSSSSSVPVVEIETMSNEIFRARRVVWAVPPKIIHQRQITFDPPLSAAKQQALEESNTWMAGVTKVALVYPSRFWSLRASNMGMPSHLGPAFQVYDSSTVDGFVSALTFFALADTKVDQSTSNKDDDNDAALAKQVATQMQNVWQYLGEKEAAQQVHTYTQYHVQRWPQQAYISEDPTPRNIQPHPHPVPALSTPEWDGLLQFAGSETDLLSPGVMEGAIGAAQRVLQSLQEAWKATASAAAQSKKPSEQATSTCDQAAVQ